MKWVQGIMGLDMIRSFSHSKSELLVIYGIIFREADNESVPIFKLQKRVIRSVCGVGTGTSCRQLLKDCKILTVTSVYVFEVLGFLKMHKSSVQKNIQVQDHITRTNVDLRIKPCNTNLYLKKSVIKWEFDCVMKY